MEGNESAEGSFSNSEKMPEQTSKKIINEYEKKANPELKKFGKKIVSNNIYELMKMGLIILAIFVIVFGYLALQDKFKTEVTCPEVNLEIPACPTFTCPNLTCPENNINLSCGNFTFPDNLEINLVNNSNG